MSSGLCGGLLLELLCFTIGAERRPGRAGHVQTIIRSLIASTIMALFASVALDHPSKPTQGKAWRKTCLQPNEHVSSLSSVEAR